MNPTLRNVLAIVVGVAVTLAVNMLIIGISGKVLPLPEGVNPNDIESIKANIDKYTTAHMVGPFLAHALGSMVGAAAACLLAVSNHKIIAIIIGAVHFLGGFAMVQMLDFKPLLFSILDLGLAYFPSALLGYWIIKRFRNQTSDKVVESYM